MKVLFVLLLIPSFAVAADNSLLPPRFTKHSEVVENPKVCGERCICVAGYCDCSTPNACNPAVRPKSLAAAPPARVRCSNGQCFVVPEGTVQSQLAPARQQQVLVPQGRRNQQPARGFRLFGRRG